MSRRNGSTVVSLEALLGPRFPTKRAPRSTASEAILVEDAEAPTWALAGDRLRAVDPGRYRRLLALAQAFVALHEPEPEPDEAHAARCAAIAGRWGVA